MKAFRKWNPDLEIEVLGGIVAPIQGRHHNQKYANAWENHKTIWLRATEPEILVLEDDATFRDDWEQILAAAMKELPMNWDFLFLGNCWNEKPVQVTPHLRHGKHTSFHAYVINLRNLDYILKTYTDMESREENVYFDLLIGNAREFNQFTVFPTVCIQCDSYSDILNRESSTIQYMLYYEAQLDFYNNCRRLKCQTH